MFSKFLNTKVRAKNVDLDCTAVRGAIKSSSTLFAIQYPPFGNITLDYCLNFFETAAFNLGV